MLNKTLVYSTILELGALLLLIPGVFSREPTWVLFIAGALALAGVVIELVAIGMYNRIDIGMYNRIKGVGRDDG